MESCYTNIIGLHQQQCPCAPVAPEDYNASTSGLYLANIKPLAEIGNWSDCAAGGIWDVLADARTQGTKIFLSEIKQRLLAKYSTLRKPYSGGLGQVENTGTKTGTTAWQGAITSHPFVRGGWMRVRGLGLNFAGAGTFNIKVVDKMGQEVEEITVTVVDGLAQNMLDTPLLLPLWNEYGTGYVEYNFIYQQSTAPAYKSNRAHCGCGGSPGSWSSSKPWWLRKAWPDRFSSAAWAMVGGFRGELEDIGSANYEPQMYGDLHGISLMVDIYCHPEQGLCPGGPAGGLVDVNSETGMAQAFAIYYQSANVALTNLLTTTSINRFKITNREALNSLRIEMVDNYTKIMQWLEDSAAHYATDCLNCAVRGASLHKKSVF